MAKAYWVARIDVHDPERYALYAAGNPPIFEKFGGRFIVRGGHSETVEGTGRGRNVVVEFPDYATALACYRSPEYRENMKHRSASATADLVIVEGYDVA